MADDTILFLKNNKQNTENLFTILKEFESFTGLKLNVKKKKKKRKKKKRHDKCGPKENMNTFSFRL